MWQPTHVQVTVQRARNLLYKGKNETNDAFVVIALGKDKFQTSIKEKATGDVSWHEECELAIPTHGNTAALGLTVYHRNALGLDEFLGQMQIPLSEFDVYERPRNKWHRLKGKPEKDRKKGEKERGDLEVRVAFTVKSGSLLDVSKKEKNKSITSLKHLGGSLMSLGNKEKASIKNFAKSVSHKIDKIAKNPGRKKNKKAKDGEGFPQELMTSRQHAGEADPGVISDSDDEGFGFDEEVRVNTRSSSPYSTISRGSSLAQDTHDEESSRLNHSNLTAPDLRPPPPKPARLGGHVEVPAIEVEPIPPPSPPSSVSLASQEPSTPAPTSPSPSLMFPNLTPINLPSHNDIQSSRESTSSDSGVTNSMTSSVAKDTSLPSLEPLSLTDAPESFQEPTPPAKKKYDAPIPQKSPTPEKRSIFNRSSSISEGSNPSSPAPKKAEKTLSIPSPLKSRSLSTSAAPKVQERTVFPSSPKEPPASPKVSALQSLVASASKVSLIERGLASPTESESKNEKNASFSNSSPLDEVSLNVSAPPTPTTPSAFTYSFGSGSATSSTPATPKGGSSGPSPATPVSRTSATPGLAERPSSAVVRSGSLHEKHTSPPAVDEWEKKLYGRNAMVGSMENMNRSDSRSSLNNSRSSSTQDVRSDDHGGRFPEIKALSLGRKELDESEGKKRRTKVGGLKTKLFGNSRERIGEEDGRIVEGGNDRLPHPPTHQSRLPQEIHDKFAGKSREDLLEIIMHQQAAMEDNVRHTKDLEDYIDGLLLRVMETTPSLLQAPVTKVKKIKVYGRY